MTALHELAGDLLDGTRPGAVVELRHSLQGGRLLRSWRHLPTGGWLEVGRGTSVSSTSLAAEVDRLYGEGIRATVARPARWWQKLGGAS